MRIEVGKAYRTNTDLIVEVIARHAGVSGQEYYTGKDTAGYTYMFRRNGACMSDDTLDLVEELPPPQQDTVPEGSTTPINLTITAPDMLFALDIVHSTLNALVDAGVLDKLHIKNITITRDEI